MSSRMCQWIQGISLAIFVAVVATVCPAETSAAKAAGLIAFAVWAAVSGTAFDRQLKAEKEETLVLIAA